MLGTEKLSTLHHYANFDKIGFLQLKNQSLEMPGNAGLEDIVLAYKPSTATQKMSPYLEKVLDPPPLSNFYFLNFPEACSLKLYCKVEAYSTHILSVMLEAT